MFPDDQLIFNNIEIEDEDIEIEVSPLTEDDLDEELIKRLKKYGYYEQK